MTSTGTDRRWILGADILWIFALMMYVLAGTSLLPFHGDESTLVMMSRDYHYQFVEGDLDRVQYHEPPLNAAEQHLRLLNGTVTKTLIGLSWHLAGYTVDDLNEQWDWSADWAWNVANGHRPADDLLLVARWHAALLTALSVPVLFALAVLWGGRWTAYPASLLLATHPVILLNGRRAIMDAPLLFFGLLTVLAASWWALRLARTHAQTNPQGARGGLSGALGDLLVSVILGVAAGLTVAGKHSGAVIVLAVYLALLTVVLGRARARGARHVGLLILSALLALGVFLLLNPAWWSDPFVRAVDVIRLRADLLANQSAAFPESVYPDLGAHLTGLIAQLSIAPTAYYEVPAWADYIADSIQTYQTSPWTGIQYGVNGLTTLLGIVFLLLALVGVGRLAQAIRAGDVTALVIGLWGALMGLFVLATISLAWQRYYMPLYPLEALLAGAGIAWLVRRRPWRWTER